MKEAIDKIKLMIMEINIGIATLINIKIVVEKSNGPSILVEKAIEEINRQIRIKKGLFDSIELLKNSNSLSFESSSDLLDVLEVCIEKTEEAVSKDPYVLGVTKQFGMRYFPKKGTRNAKS